MSDPRSSSIARHRRPLVAGVDSSTQSTKVVVCEAETGAVIRSGRAAHPDRTEVDPQVWWQAYQVATDDGLLDDVQAISVGGQQHGMVTLDEDGRVVRPALLWNDTRSASAAGELVTELGGPQAWVDAVGVVPVAAITVTKLRWLARNEPENAAQVADVVLPHDWLTGRILAGGAARPPEWVTDRGDASGTGYFCAARNLYRPDLLQLALGEVTGCAVPRVLGPREPAGHTASGMLVGPGTGDNMGAALGLGLGGGSGDVVVSLGTSGTAFAASQTPPRDPTGAVSGFADATGGHLPLVCTLNAARVLTAAASLLHTDLVGIDRLALQANPGAGGLSLLPYLDGERTPDLPEATGTLGGLTRLNATPENLARAAVEGMLCNLADGVDALRANGVDTQRILLVGGAAASAAVRQIASQVFGLPVAVPTPGEYVALGAARQAAWALTGGDQPPAWSVQIETERPVVDPSTGQELRTRYANLLRARHGR